MNTNKQQKFQENQNKINLFNTPQENLEEIKKEKTFIKKSSRAILRIRSSKTNFNEN